MNGILLYGASEIDSNIYYATKFIAPDPFIYLEISGTKIIVVSELEYGRAKDQAKVDKVISLNDVEKKLISKTLTDIIYQLLKDFSVASVTVPANFWIEIADGLRSRSVEVKFKSGNFFEQRETKSNNQIKNIKISLRVAEQALDTAINIVKKAKIRGRYLKYKSETLTSEYVRNIINQVIISRGCVPAHTIVAGGNDACDPHNEGHGPLIPHKPIVLDIFPRSLETLYWGDITRTVIKGSPSPELTRMYDAVLKAQQVAINMMKAGGDAKVIHKAVRDFFSSHGYKTERVNNKMNGFFHGTGHGLGLDIHEPPPISEKGSILKKGTVVTIEPGLYYFGIGGIRIEDVVLVTKTGCIQLTKYPKFFQV